MIPGEITCRTIAKRMAHLEGIEFGAPPVSRVQPSVPRLSLWKMRTLSIEGSTPGSVPEEEDDEDE